LKVVTASDLDEYLAEIRARVCSRCIERPPHGPPCGPLGKRCGIELHLPAIVGVAQSSRSRLIDPYMEAFHRDVCAHCTNQPTSQCPCPLDYLLLLAIEAIDAVDARRGGGESDA
jgi:hypothetical protein